MHIVWILLSLGVAFLANSRLHGSITHKSKGIVAKGSIAIFFTILLILEGTSYIYNKSFGYTVYLRDTKNHIVIRSGSLSILFNNAPRIEQVDQHGSVSYRGISSELKGDSVSAELIGLPDWQFTNGTSSVKLALSGEKNILYVVPNRKRCCIEGIVVNRRNRLVENAEVWTGAMTPVRTSVNGIFKIELSEDQQLEDQFEVYVRKGTFEGKFSLDRSQNQTPTFQIQE